MFLNALMGARQGDQDEWHSEVVIDQENHMALAVDHFSAML